MLDSTKTAIRAIAQADPSVTKEQLDAALDALAGNTAAGLVAPVPIDRVVNRKQAAEILNIKPHTVSDYCKRGWIRPIRLGAKGKLAVGYSLESIRTLMEGRAGS